MTSIFARRHARVARMLRECRAAACKVQVAKTYDILQLSTTEKSIDTENMEEYVPHFKAKQHIS